MTRHWSDDSPQEITVEGLRMKRITLNVDLAEARDLLERAPRACVAFAHDADPQVESATVLFESNRYLVGMLTSVRNHVTAGDEVVLLVDDGVQFFDLRAAYVRGYVLPLTEPENPGGGLFWFEVQPTRAVAWDYARIRELDHES